MKTKWIFIPRDFNDPPKKQGLFQATEWDGDKKVIRTMKPREILESASSTMFGMVLSVADRMDRISIWVRKLFHELTRGKP